MTGLLGVGRETFSSLANPNYRRYFAGQAISRIGTWMQMIAQSWLVLTLTGSSVLLGLVVALQALPVLLLGPYGGLVADRVDKRRLMVVLQTVMAVQALALGVLTVSGTIRVWEIALLAALLGLNNAFETPARQAFMLEMVGPAELRNAVSLNSVMVNVARAVGPAAAGIVIAVAGEGICFLVNAASFVAVVASLLTLDTSQLSPSPPAGRSAGQLREGLRYVRRTPELAVPLVLMAIVGMLTYEFSVSLPVLARSSLEAGAQGYGYMTAAMGAGAVAGGLVVAARGRTGLRPLVLAAAGFGVLVVCAALAPNLTLELAALVLVGAASVSFIAIANSTLQLRSAPDMRGRVMGLWIVAFQGSTPIGGPLIGWIISRSDARVGLAVGAAAALVAAALGAVVLHRLAPTVVPPPHPTT
ncbi:MAG TPA: MFS transporter [Gaiella sp.]|nr:MFS transporter [Gaiella sp.]